MKKLKIKSLLLLSLIICFIGIIVCRGNNRINNNQKDDSHYPVIINTYNDKLEPIEITFTEEPDKVVTRNQSSIDTLIALGLEDKLISVPSLCEEDYISSTVGKVRSLSGVEDSDETMIVGDNNYLFGWYSFFNNKTLNISDSINVKTYICSNIGFIGHRSIENELNDILKLGKIFNVVDRAEAIVSKIKITIDEVLFKSSKREKQNAIIIEFLDDKIYAYGENTLLGNIVIELGGNLLTANGVNLIEEDLIRLNPDCIFVVYVGNEDSSIEKINKLMKNPNFEKLDVVKNNRISYVKLSPIYFSGINIIDGINLFENGLYDN